jgi:hypothetical protein
LSMPPTYFSSLIHTTHIFLLSCPHHPHISYVIIQCVPLATEPGISLIILPLMRILQWNFKRTYTYTNTHEQQLYCVGTLS